MCLRTLVASDNPLPEISTEKGFAVHNLQSCDVNKLMSGESQARLRSYFKKPYIYYVECAFCGCELRNSLDLETWEEDLDTLVRKEMEQIKVFQEKYPEDPRLDLNQVEPDWVERERWERHSRHMFWEYLSAAKANNREIEVFGGWAAGNKFPPERASMTIEELGLEGVQEGVVLTINLVPE